MRLLLAVSVLIRLQILRATVYSVWSGRKQRKTVDGRAGSGRPWSKLKFEKITKILDNFDEKSSCQAEIAAKYDIS